MWLRFIFQSLSTWWCYDKIHPVVALYSASFNRLVLWVIFRISLDFHFSTDDRQAWLISWINLFWNHFSWFSRSLFRQFKGWLLLTILAWFVTFSQEKVQTNGFRKARIGQSLTFHKHWHSSTPGLVTHLCISKIGCSTI